MSASRAIPRRARSGSTASSSRTRRARTSSPGSARPSRSSRCARRCPRRSTSSWRRSALLESHYRDLQDIEFTVEEGRLFILQTRTGKRTAAAALRVAVEMVDEELISRDEAVARIDPAQLDQLLHPADRPERGDRGRDARPERLARSGLRRDRPRRRHRRGARQGGRRRDPRALGDDARRHPRPDPRARRPDRARRHDLARRGGRARHGEAVRRGLRRALDRLQGRHDQDRRARALAQET